MTRLLIPLLPLLLALVAHAAPTSASPRRLAPGEPLTLPHAAGLVEAALRDRGMGERFEVDIEAPPLPLPNRAGRFADLTLDGLRHEPHGGRFTASLRVRLESGEASTIELAGQARELVEVPVLARRVERGALIEAEDVELRWLADGLVRGDAARDPADVVGREARRTLAAGRVLRAADLAEPRLVARGQAVTMVYAGGGLEITALGEAIDHGSLGGVVRVVNPASRLVREAVVVGPGRVRIGGAPDGRLP